MKEKFDQTPEEKKIEKLSEAALAERRFKEVEMRVQELKDAGGKLYQWIDGAGHKNFRISFDDKVHTLKFPYTVEYEESAENEEIISKIIDDVDRVIKAADVIVDDKEDLKKN